MARQSLARQRCWEAARSYRDQMPGSPAAVYLAGRGITSGAAEPLGLGYVAEPLPGHERYAGRLAIPYLRRGPRGEWSIPSLRFRCPVPDCEHSDHAKYMSLPGDPPRLYNTTALDDNPDYVAVCEGELDAVTAAELCGVPTVGVPGAEAWQKHFVPLFEGYARVYVLCDGDDAGHRFGKTVAKELTNAETFPAPPGEDVNSEYMAKGSEALPERIGLK